jgi:hypothetical protein
MTRRWRYVERTVLTGNRVTETGIVKSLGVL